jgi:hypothetical protein
LSKVCIIWQYLLREIRELLVWYL